MWCGGRCAYDLLTCILRSRKVLPFLHVCLCYLLHLYQCLTHPKFFNCSVSYNDPMNSLRHTNTSMCGSINTSIFSLFLVLTIKSLFKISAKNFYWKKSFQLNILCTWENCTLHCHSVHSLFTHSITHYSPIQSLIIHHSITHYSPIQSLIIRPFNHSLFTIHSLIIHPFNHSLFTHSSTHYSLIQSLIIHPFNHSYSPFNHSLFTHSITHYSPI